MIQKGSEQKKKAPGETKKNYTATHDTHLNGLGGGLRLLERLSGVIDDVDLHALSLVAKVGVQGRSRSLRDVVAR